MIIKKIKGFENYTINEYGIVINTKTGKNVKPYIDSKNRYLIIRLNKNNKRTRFLVHRLVAINFLENPNNYPVVNHKDNTTRNNHYKNLEWCTTQYNIHQSYKQMSPTRNFINCIATYLGKNIGEYNSKRDACKDISKKYNISFASLNRYGKSGGYAIIVKCND